MHVKVDYALIGKRLQTYRKNIGFTQEQVAEKAEITTVYLSKIENGKVSPTLDTLATICAIVQGDLGFVVSGCQYSQEGYGNDAVVELFRSCSPAVKPIALNLLKELSKLEK